MHRTPTHPRLPRPVHGRLPDLCMVTVTGQTILLRDPSGALIRATVIAQEPKPDGTLGLTVRIVR